MYEDVESKLIENEQIEMTLETDIRKTKKYWEKYVYSLILVIILWALFIYTYCVNHTIAGINYSAEGFSFDKMAALIGTIFITLFGIFFFLYDVMISTKNRFNKYWLTNIRIISFNNKKGYIIRNIERIDRIGTYNIKDNYADIVIIFKKVTASDKAELPILLTGIKNYEEVVNYIKSKNEDITLFTDENLGKKKKTVTNNTSDDTIGEIMPRTTVDTSGIQQMDANKPSRHLGTPTPVNNSGVDPNKIPMSDAEAEAQKAAIFKKTR